MAVKALREEHKDLTRSTVLQAAGRLFAERGYAAVTIDEIAVTARVSKGAVYYHFAEKAKLFEAAFREGQARLVESVLEATSAQSDSWERFDGALASYLVGAIGDAKHRALLQQAAGALGAERCREIDEEIGLPLLLEALRQLDREQRLGPAPSELLTRMIFSALCEAAMIAGSAEDPETAGAQALAALKALTAGLRKS